ncbi:MAG: hypothetical protein KDA91_24570, partial [Planctomycetaceae bacterium]|nr:hypothetical protein [Planctomycetaceae bacterium]
MKDRRPLIAGITAPSNDVAELEKQFVYGGRPESKTEVLSEAPTPVPESPEPSRKANVPADRAAPVITGR